MCSPLLSAALRVRLTKRMALAEPRAFNGRAPDVYPGKQTDVQPEVLARDLTTTVRGILRDANDQAAVWGPDVSSPSPTSFFRSFLEGVHANKSQHPPVLQAATYHQYYNGSLPPFLPHSVSD